MLCSRFKTSELKLHSTKLQFHINYVATATATLYTQIETAEIRFVLFRFDIPKWQTEFFQMINYIFTLCSACIHVHYDNENIAQTFHSNIPLTLERSDTHTHITQSYCYFIISNRINARIYSDFHNEFTFKFKCMHFSLLDYSLWTLCTIITNYYVNTQTYKMDINKTKQMRCILKVNCILCNCSKKCVNYYNNSISDELIK